MTAVYSSIFCKMSQFSYFLFHITVILKMIHFFTARQINVLNSFMKYFSGARAYETVNKCLVFAICYLGIKKLSLKNIFALQRNRWCWKSAIRMFLKKIHCQITLYLFAGFKTIFLCSVYTLWFMKYVFTAKIWFVKTSTRIVKYESGVVKSDPAEPPNTEYTFLL